MDSETLSVLNKVYEERGYFDKYGGSLILSILIVLFVIIIFLYFHVQNNLQPLKQDWANVKCNPAYMPFAHVINGDPNQPGAQFVTQNFFDCVGDMIAGASIESVNPVYKYIRIFGLILKIFSEALQAIRKIFANMRAQMMAFVKSIYTRLVSAMSPLQFLIVKMVSIFSKISGVITAVIYTVLGVYEALKAFMGSIVRIIIMFLVAMLVVVLVLWIMSAFMWWLVPVAVAKTAIFIVVLVMLSVIASFANNVAKASTAPIPGKLAKGVR